MQCELQFSSRSAAALLAQIFGPAIDDSPRFNADRQVLDGLDLASDRHADPWYAHMLNPRPLPPRDQRVMALADAYIKEFIRLDRLGTLLGGEAADRATERALGMVADIAARCPHWPQWPQGWPVPVGLEPRATMTSNELLAFGSLILSASELIDLEPLRDALVNLSEAVLCLSMNDQPAARASSHQGRRLAFHQ